MLETGFAALDVPLRSGVVGGGAMGGATADAGGERECSGVRASSHAHRPGPSAMLARSNARAPFRLRVVAPCRLASAAESAKNVWKGENLQTEKAQSRDCEEWAPRISARCLAIGAVGSGGLF